MPATTRDHATAITRATGSIHVPVPDAGQLLVPSQIIFSPETKLQYRIERLLGAGGFGQAYLATRRGRSSTVPEQVCIKVSARIDGWLREAYFGLLLDGNPRAVRVFDRFPLMRADGQVLYYLALEYACHGDLSAHLQGGGKAFTEAAARREIAGILEVLGRLHRGHLLHRDLTPMNVFVCDGRKLKLGDFGIVRHASNVRGVTAGTMNVSMVPSDILASAAPKWQTRDDVYQVGQLLAMLIKGDARARIRPHDVRSMTCSDQLKEIIYRCIGERRKRYEAADDLIAALRTPPKRLNAGVQRSLDGVHLAFTGILSRPRDEAKKAAKRAGAIVHSGPSAKTTVLVRGRPNPLQAAGRDGGIKLLEIKRLAEKGHRIQVLGDAAFWRLVDAGRSRPPARLTPASASARRAPTSGTPRRRPARG